MSIKPEMVVDILPTYCNDIIKYMNNLYTCVYESVSQIKFTKSNQHPCWIIIANFRKTVVTCYM